MLKNKEAYEITLLSVCLCIPHPLRLKAGIVEPEKIYLCICMCTPLQLLGNGSVNMFPGNKKNCWTRRFLCGPCQLKGK
jgi:hypothetical protein